MQSASQADDPILITPDQLLDGLAGDRLGQQTADGDGRGTAVSQEGALRDPPLAQAGFEVKPVAAARVRHFRDDVGVVEPADVAWVGEVLDDRRTVPTHWPVPCTPCAARWSPHSNPVPLPRAGERTTPSGPSARRGTPRPRQPGRRLP